MLICLYEDRPQQLPGVKLAVLSTVAHCPDWQISLTVPTADERFCQWVAQFPQVQLSQQRPAGAGSYNVKPAILLSALASGADECVWFDTDVIVNGLPTALLNLSDDTVVVTQDPWEYPSGSSHRATTWGFQVGRDLPGSLNSAVVRVTQQHIGLLTAWLQLTQRPDYLESQTKPIHQRHGHKLSDQDLLSALLASTEFSKFPVKRLMHGVDILQHHGAGAYGLPQRMRTLKHGLPPLLHAMGTVKPWLMPEHPSLVNDFRGYYERVYLELSPYLHVARQYRHVMDESCPWMDIQTTVGHVSKMVSFSHPGLMGMTQATLHRATMALRTQRGLYRGSVVNG